MEQIVLPFTVVTKMKVAWIHPKKEFVIKRKCVKHDLKCHEGSHLIKVGEEYYEDHISYVKRKNDGSGFLWWHNHIVCENCWKGVKLVA